MGKGVCIFLDLPIQLHCTDMFEQHGVLGKGSQDPGHLEINNVPCWGSPSCCREVDGGAAQEGELIYYRGENAFT